MLKLFQSIFGRESKTGSAWPETLVEAVIERAVDGTDPRLRALGGYRKRLREPALATIDHVMRLVDELPAPLAATAENYRNDACLRSMFASPERMFEVIGRDQNLEAALRAGPSAGKPFTALLMTRMSEKHTLGIDLEDEVLKRDVQQTIVSFDGHRLIDPCADAAETRRLLKRRAYDHILAQVLEAMARRRTTRTGLAGQRELLQRKSAALEGAGWSFEAGGDKAPPDAAALESELARIEEELGKLGPDSVTLDAHLDMLAEALAAPAKRLWVEERSMILDHRNVLRMQADSVARELQLRELHDGRGTRMVALLLDIDPGAAAAHGFLHGGDAATRAEYAAGRIDTLDRRTPMAEFRLLTRTRQITEYSCGASALQAVLSYWGRELDETAIMKIIGTSEDVGTYPENIVRGVRALGLQVEARENLTLDEVRRFGHPMIALCQVWRSQRSSTPRPEDDWDNGHYIVVLGVDEEYVYFQDPYLHMGKAFVTRATFERHWHQIMGGEAAGNPKLVHLGILIRGDRPARAAAAGPTAPGHWISPGWVR